MTPLLREEVRIHGGPGSGAPASSAFSIRAAVSLGAVQTAAYNLGICFASPLLFEGINILGSVAELKI